MRARGRRAFTGSEVWEKWFSEAESLALESREGELVWLYGAVLVPLITPNFGTSSIPRYDHEKLIHCVEKVRNSQLK